MTFQCERCHYETDVKTNMARHLQKKIPCSTLHSSTPRETLLCKYIKVKDASKAISCDKCCKVFHSKQGLTWHMREKHTNHDTEDTANTTSATDHRVEQLERQVAELQAQMDKRTSNTQNIQTQNNIQQQNNNITINAFGKEDISYILNNPKFMWSCLRNQHLGICDYITTKHFNGNHPENQNIRKLNKKSNMIEFHDGEKWRINLKDYVLNLIMRDLECDVKTFITKTFTDERPISKEANKIVDKYMESVGTSFEWDFNCDQYEFEDILDDLPEGERAEAIKQRNDLRKQIYELAIEHIYTESKKLHTVV
jgi:hypothetical protein